MRTLIRCILTLVFIVASLLMQSVLQTKAKDDLLKDQTVKVKAGNMLGLRLAVYHVSDIEKAKIWYGKVLNVKPNFDQPFYVGFTVGGFELGLMPEKGDNSVKSAGVVAYWGVDDAKASYKKLLDSGAKPHEEVKDVGGGILAGTVIDPFGNEFGIIQNPYFKMD